MNLEDRVVVVTGAAGGIGAALVRACGTAGARVAATDVRASGLDELTSRAGAAQLTAACDVTDAAATEALLARVEEELGPVDVLVANAGVAIGTDPVGTPDEVWDRALAVNLRAHVIATRALLPRWLERGEGYFVSVASAAGLLTQIGSAPYAVSKHAAVGYAEWLSVTYGSRGLRVSCVCPMGVDTDMLVPGVDGALDALGSSIVRGAGDVLAPAAVADLVVEAIGDERFLVLPHPAVLTHFQRKGSDYERWLAGMRRLQDATAGRA